MQTMKVIMNKSTEKKKQASSSVPFSKIFNSSISSIFFVVFVLSKFSNEVVVVVEVVVAIDKF